jgi:hypothetical protein
MNIVSSSLWITYSQMISDMPLLIRGSSDLLLFSISSVYIVSNRIKLYKSGTYNLPSLDIVMTLEDKGVN